MASDYVNTWIDLKTKLDKLELSGEGKTQTAIMLRSHMIAHWNCLRPQQQKELAIKYYP